MQRHRRGDPGSIPGPRPWLGLAGPILAACAILAACGDGTGPTPSGRPDVRGGYTADWTLVFTETTSGQGHAISCPGTLTVGQQDEGNFAGSFEVRRTSDCQAGSGPLSGTVQADGALTLRLDVPGSGGTGIVVQSCETTRPPDTLRGSAANGRLSVSTTEELRCTLSGAGTFNYGLRVDLSATRR